MRGEIKNTEKSFLKIGTKKILKRIASDCRDFLIIVFPQRKIRSRGLTEWCGRFSDNHLIRFILWRCLLKSYVHKTEPANIQYRAIFSNEFSFLCFLLPEFSILSLND